MCAASGTCAAFAWFLPQRLPGRRVATGTRRAQLGFVPTSNPFVIVVGIDYSEAGDLALERALELAADKPGSEVHVLHVIPTRLATSELEMTPLPSVENATTELQTYVAERLRTIAARSSTAERVPPRVVTHLRVAVPAQAVAQLGSDLNADLVIVGTHGRKGVPRWLLGSVAESTVRRAPCPVLVVRPNEESEALPAIAPSCPDCIEARKHGSGRQLWCDRH